MKINSRRKGASFERKIAARLREEFPKHADAIRRSDQGNGAKTCDVTGLPKVWLELQHASRASSDPVGKLLQAIEDAPGDEFPIAVTHVTGTRSVEATMRASDFLRLWLLAGTPAIRVPVTFDFEDLLVLLRAAMPEMEGA